MEEFEKEEVMKSLSEHLEYVKRKYPQLKVLGIFVVGSHNYGLSLQTDEYKSNLDSIVITQGDGSFPRHIGLIKGGKDNIRICDRRCFLTLLRACPCNGLEALFTEFKIIEDDRLNILIKNADKLVNEYSYRMQHDIIQNVICQCQMMQSSIQQTHKRVYNVFRLYVLARDMFYGIPYTEALHPDSVDTNILLDIKTGRFAEKSGTTLQHFVESLKVSAENLKCILEKLANEYTFDSSEYDLLNEFEKQFE